MATTLYVTPTRVIFGGGKFDSDNRYLRAGNASADMPITKGITFFIERNPPGQDTAWRYSVAGYVVNYGTLTNSATYTLVKT